MCDTQSVLLNQQLFNGSTTFMSANYAAGLSPCDSRGVCGLPEIHDPEEESAEKIRQLAQWMREAKHCVLVVGAGISTAAGIPDFRGPNGIWTKEKEEKDRKKQNKRLKLSEDSEKEVKEEEEKKTLSLDDARPTLTHLFIKSLLEKGVAKYLISQNVDGLFLKTGQFVCMTP